MRFHGMMLLRDEEDVIGECFEHLLTWIDSIYIMDLGSTDATWDIVQHYAKKDSRVKPLMHKGVVYRDNLRCWAFHRARENFEDGDWCMKIDADEFYHLPPPKFVPERLGKLDSAVYLQWYFFRLTASEVAAYESGKVDWREDRKRSITDRRRFYKLSEYAEPRMFKYRRSMKWPETTSFPINAGFVARERIPIRHYPHRDPEQMKRRFRLRAAMMRMNGDAGGHWSLEDWRQEIVDDQGTSVSQKTNMGLASQAGIDTGKLLYWAPGTTLPETRMYGHVKSGWPRLAQRIMHPLLLPVLDPRRPSYSPGWELPYIDDAVNEQIGRDCLVEHASELGQAAKGRDGQ